MNRLLIIGSNKVQQALAGKLYDISTFSDLPPALDALKTQKFDLVLLSTQEMLKELEKVDRHTPKALIPNEHIEEEIENLLLATSQVIAMCPTMLKLIRSLPQIAKSNASVFINGESGTGKEVIAQAIHHLSLRKKAPFVKVNCAAIPESLLESEFFGHEKGAFTGAISRRLGRFELADKGTLLLDEISEIPLSVQSKLLRAVQEQEFERVGGNTQIDVNVRFISTSNRNIKEAIEQKIFREDLYYRLNVIPIYLPPLRERREDILPLAKHFLRKLSKEGAVLTLSTEAEKKLLNYSWPGNVRELSNIIERALVTTTDGEIGPEILTLEMPSQARKGKEVTLKELEKRHILEILTTCQNNKTRAAKTLGISIRTLRNKLSQYAK